MADNLLKQVALGSNTYELDVKYLQNDGTATSTLPTELKWSHIKAYIDDLAEKGFKAIVSTDAASTPKGVSWKDGETTITGTLEASAADKNAIYFVPETSKLSGNYVEYVVVGDTTPAWERIGSTHLDLSNYLQYNTEYADAALSAGAHTHTVSGSVTVPTVTSSAKKLKIGTTSVATSKKTTANAITGFGNHTTADAITGFGAHTTDTFVKSYPGATNKMVTTSVTSAVDNGQATLVTFGTDATASKATAGTAVSVAKAGTKVSITPAGTAVSVATVGDEQSIVPAVAIAEGDRPTKTVFGTATTASKVTIGTSSAAASKATAGTAKDIAKAGTAVTVATGIAAGESTDTLTGYTPSVSAAGVLSFSAVYAKANTTTVIPAVDNGSITPYSFDDVDIPTISADDVTVPVVSSNAAVEVAKAGTAVTFNAAGTATSVATVGTAVEIVPAVANGTITPYTFADVTVPVITAHEDKDIAKTATSATTVATGSLDATGTGATVMTGLGTASTAAAITALGTPTTAAAITALGTPTTAAAITELNTADVVNSVAAAADGTIDYVESITVGSASASLTSGEAASAGAHVHTVKAVKA